MGRFIDSHSAGSPAASVSTMVDESQTQRGRNIELSRRGENLLTDSTRTMGRVRTRREEEQAWLESEEGQRMVEEINKRIEEDEEFRQRMLDEEQLAEYNKREEQQKAFERTTASQAFVPTAIEEDVSPYAIREARLRSREQFEEDLRTLGVPEEQIATFDGIDEKKYYEVINEISEENMATYAAKSSWSGLKAFGNAWFNEEYDVRLPFEKEKTTEFQGIGTAILMDMYWRIVFEGIPRVTYQAAANINQISGGGDSVQIPFDKRRFGMHLEGEDLTQEEKTSIVSSGERMHDRWAFYNEKNPPTDSETELGYQAFNIWNGFKAAWDTAIMDVFDVWVVSDLVSGAARHVAGQNVALVQRDLQRLGLNPKEIAHLGNMSDDAVRELIKKRTLERFNDILGLSKDTYKPGAARVALDATATIDDQMKASSEIFRMMVKEGSMTPAQAAETYRLIATLQNLGVQFNSGALQSIPRILQHTNNFAAGLTAPVGGGGLASGTFKARPIGAKPKAGRMGLSIENVSNFGDDAANARMAKFNKAVSEDEKLKGFEFQYDDTTNTVLISSKYYDEFTTNRALQALVVGYARGSEANVAYVDDAARGAELTELDLQYILKEFDANPEMINAIRKEAEDALLARKGQIAKADEITTGLPEDSGIVQAVTASGISQSELKGLLESIQSDATGRSIQGNIVQELLNTPAQSKIVQKPIRRTALRESSPFEKKLLESQKSIVSHLADLARQTPTTKQFEDLYGFLTKASSRPSVEYPGTGMFDDTRSAKNRVDDFVEMGFVTRGDIKSIIRTELPSGMVDVPSTERFKLTTKIVAGNEEAVGEYFAQQTGANEVQQIVSDSVFLRNMLNTTRHPDPEEVLSLLTSDYEKPEIPFFAITEDGRAILLSQEEGTRQAIAAAKVGGVETIPAYVVDYHGNLTAFRDFLKDNNMTLRQFAVRSRGLEPKLTGRKVSKAGDVKLMREEAGLASGKLTRIGTSNINSIVVPTKLIREDLPVDIPVLWNNMLSNNRVNIPSAELAGLGGTARDVYSFGPDAVIKVAKGLQGQVQNLQIYNWHAISKKLIPRLFEGGKDYITVEKYGALDGRGLELHQQFSDAWVQYLSDHKEVNRELFDIAESKLEVGDVTKQMLDMDRAVFDFLDQWRNSDAALLGVTKDGNKLFNWDEFAHYRVASGDMLKESTWGTRPDGTMVVIDEGAMNAKAINFVRYGTPEQWEKYIADADEIIIGNKASREKYGNFDAHNSYSFMPTPVTDGDEEYEDDIWKSALMTIAFGMARGKGRVPKRTPKQQAKLPQSTQPRTVPVGKGILNPDAWIAKTGDKFGGVFFKTNNVKGSPVGIKVLDSYEMIAPLGDKAGYTFLTRDQAVRYGEYSPVKNHGDNVLVIRNDTQFRQLVKDAGIENQDLSVGWTKATKENVKQLRIHIEKELGHDGVIILLDNNSGPIELLGRLFEYDQFVSFNPKYLSKPLGSNMQTVATKSTARTKKAQRQIMKMIDPPASKVEMNEMQALRDRLKLINKTIKEGKKIGVAEARPIIVARLRNSFLVQTDRLRRNQELMRLRQRIIDREKTLIKKEMVAYAKEVLPTTMSREFLAARGKLISGIVNIETRAQLYKQLTRIDKMREQVERKLLVQKIGIVSEKIMNSKQVSADYRTLVRELMKDIDLSKHTEKTMRNLVKMRNYIEQQKALGNDVLVTEEMQASLEILAKKGVEQFNINDLRNLLDRLEVMGTIGRTKRRREVEIYEALKEKRQADLIPGLSPIEKKAQLIPKGETIGGSLSKQDKTINAFRHAQNSAQLADLAITPVSTVFDLMGSGKGLYTEAPYRLLKALHARNFNGYLDDVNKLTNEYKTLLKKTDTDTPYHRERIGAYMAKQQGKNVIERMVAQGIDEKELLALELTANEMEVAVFVGKHFMKERPILKDLARRLYNVEFHEVENFFPMLTDFGKIADEPIQLRFGDNIPTIKAKRRIFKAGTLRQRSKRAKVPIKIDVSEVFLSHMDNTLYMKHMAEDVKMISEIAGTPEFAEAAGEVGTKLATEYLDLLARKGGASGQVAMPVIDFLNKNAGVAVLAFKLSSALIQVSAIGQGASMIGLYAFRGAEQFAVSRGVREFVFKNMPTVRETVVDDIGFLDKPYFNGLERAQEIGYYPLKQLDSVTRGSVAYGAYLQKLKELGLKLDLAKPNKEALDYAERITILTQSSSFYTEAPLALSRGTGVTGFRSLNRALFKFQSFMLSQWNLIRNELWRFGIRGDGAKNKMKAVRILMWLILTKLAEMGIRDLAREAQNMITGKDSDDEDVYTATSIAKEAASTVPFVSQSMSIIIYDSNPIPFMGGFQIGGEGFGRAMAGSTPQTQLKGVVDVAAGVGTVVGVPGMFQARSGLKDWIDANAEEEEGGSGTGTRPERPTRPTRPTR